MKTPLFWGVFIFGLSKYKIGGIVASYLLDVRYIDE
ncbi:hypothetical protein C1S86_20960 [Vibrio parahaemolyticus]|nr:hypothetical protein DA442_08230 [Vibrio parahaemolyticus]EGQ8158399.1 hypothetical protein [Vibrio parahaemolyticus]EGQ8232746.1 hypothetical protein [Vibrio parahaemolyticus]EGQ8291957.1 hypothetical protein [Vibrio parahaemolyticus]EGQ8300648.1 hypothetical protein [Vibrio parahaemolyticus]